MLDFILICSIPVPADAVSWWPAGGNASDALSTNNGTLIDGVTYDTGEVGQAFSFNGADGYAEVPSSPALSPTGPFTVEGWVNYDSLYGPYGSVIVAKGEDVEGPVDWAMSVSASSNLRPHLNIPGQDWYYFDCYTTLLTNTWYHVAMVYDGTNLTGYVNGADDRSLSVTGQVQSTEYSLRIGAYAPVNGEPGYSKCFFAGRIDELTFYNRALAPAEIQAIYNAGAAGKINPNCVSPSTDATGWWAADGDPYDLVQTNVATLHNGVTYESGVVAQAFRFNGTNNYAEVPSSPGLRFTNAFTVEGWINYDSLYGPYGSVIVAKGQDVEGPVDWALAVSSSCNLRPHVHTPGGWYYFDCNTPLQPGGWYHVAMVYDGAISNLTGYVNGESDGSIQVSGAVQATDYSLRIGAYAPVNGAPGYSKCFFPGRIDELTVYNRALSDTEIAAIYSAGCAGKCRQPPAIITQPTNQTVVAGNTASFTVVATGARPLIYQWHFNGTNLPGATNTSLTLANVAADQAGTYSVTVSNRAGWVTSSNASLTVLVPPSITTQPASQAVAPGGSAIFSVAADGSAPLAYQWFHDGSAIADATASSLALSGVSLYDSGDCKVTVANGAGSTNSTTATLTVTGVAAPAFSPPGGSYVSAQNVAVTCPTMGAVIHYTLSGQEPTESDPTVASGSTVLVDHTLTLKAKAWQTSWAASDTETEGYRIEPTPSNQPPTVAISPPTGTTILASDDLEILVEASDPDGTVTKIQLFRDGLKVAEATESPLRYTVASAVAGTYTFTAKAFDDAGFVTVSSPVTITVSASGPVVSLTGQQPFFTSSPGTLVAAVLGVNPGSLASLRLNGALVTAKTGGFTLDVPLTQGSNTFTLIATDNLSRTAQASATVYLDSVPPVISISAPANNSSFNTVRINVSGNFTETSLKRITVNGLPAFITGTNFQALNVPLAVGTNTVTATAEDLAGNTSSATITVIGTDTPVDPVQLQATPAGGFAPLTVTFQPQATVPGTLQQALYDFTGDNTTFQTATNLQPVSHAYTTPGQYFPVVTIQTTAGTFSSPGGWNGDPDRLRINVQSPPILVSTINITDPVDLKWTANSNLYVLSRSAASITEFDSNGNIVRSVSGIGTTPNGLDVDNAGNVYVAVTGDNQVKKFNPISGSFQLDTTFNGTGFIGKADRSSGTGEGEFDAPFDVAVSPDGEEVSISDSANHRIQRFSQTGVFVGTFGEPGTEIGQFNTPRGLACDDIGTVFILDSGNDRVELATPPLVFAAGGAPGSALGQFQGAVNLSVGTRGVYVADTGNNRVQALAQPKDSPTLFSPRLALAAELGLSQPRAVAAVTDLVEERVYIADTGNNRVLLVRLPGDNSEAVWNAMKQRLIAGDITGAIQYFSTVSADDYREGFLTLGPSTIAAHTSDISAISPIYVEGDTAQYRFDQVIEEVTITFPINFIKENGQWKILEY